MPGDSSIKPRLIELAKLGSRNRVIVPEEISEDLPWFDRSHGFDCLLRFDELGRISLLGPDALARYRKEEARLLELQDDDAKWNDLLSLAIRFQPATFEKESRITLPKEAAAHLQIGDPPPAQLWVVRRRMQIEVWNELFRIESIARAGKTFSGVVD
jgi:hypothetical protein